MPLRNIIEGGTIPNMIFYGPSGIGKTTVAGIIAAKTNKRLHRLNGTTASTKDIKEIVDELDTMIAPNGVLLYLDEIQYFNKRQQQSLLQYMENGKIKAVSPSWRGDIEGEHDLVEEVVRMIGLDKIPAVTLPNAKFPKEILTPIQHNVMIIKHELASRGMYETVTWSFADSEVAQYFRKGNEAILLQNPIVKELDEMRPSVLPNLLTAVKNNMARGYANLALFEVGPEFTGRHPTEQHTVATGIRAGQTAKKDWSASGRAYDVFDVKADALAVIAAAKGPYENPQITADAPSYYHPGRSGTIRLGKNVLAYFGEIHPSILKAMDIKTRVMAFEVNINNIPLPRQAHGKARKKLELSAFQPIDKDLAFVVNKDVSAAAIIAAAKNADREHITDVRIFDIYEGENLPQGKKSVAISLTFQPIEQTFTDKDIENLMNKAIVEVGKKTGGELR